MVLTESQLLSLMKEDMICIERWMRLNKLEINYNKSVFIVFGRSVNYPWLKELDIGESVISRRNVVKYLLALTDETICFSEHIQCISSKIARNVGFLRELKY